MKIIEDARAKYPQVSWKGSPARKYGLDFSWANGVEDIFYHQFRDLVKEWLTPKQAAKPAANQVQIKVVDGREVTAPTDSEIRADSENNAVAAELQAALTESATQRFLREQQDRREEILRMTGRPL